MPLGSHHFKQRRRVAKAKVILTVEVPLGCILNLYAFLRVSILISYMNKKETTSFGLSLTTCLLVIITGTVISPILNVKNEPVPTPSLDSIRIVLYINCSDTLCGFICLFPPFFSILLIFYIVEIRNRHCLIVCKWCKLFNHA